MAQVNVTNTVQEMTADSSQEIINVESSKSEVQEYHTEHSEQHHKDDFELDVSITTQVQEETYVEVETESDVEAAIARGRLFYNRSIPIKFLFSLQGINQIKC